MTLKNFSRDANGTAFSVEYIKGQDFRCFQADIIQAKHHHLHSLCRHTTILPLPKIPKTKTTNQAFKRNHPPKHQTPLLHLHTPTRPFNHRLQQKCPTLSSSNISPLLAPASATAKFPTTATRPCLRPPHRTSAPTCARPSAARAVKPSGVVSVGSRDWEECLGTDLPAALDTSVRVRPLSL